MSESKSIKWVVPPGLNKTFQEFCALYESLFKDAEKSAKKSPIMIIGPPGVGKTLFSETFGKLYQKQFQISQDKIRRLNVAAIPENLIESELFGHLKGAFTGAIRDKKGLVEEVAGGVLVLEEIGELSQSIQAKLLTFIEDGYFYRVGDTKPRKSEGLQIIATTNKTKEDNVFRQDFLDRFFPFFIPPLYQRRADILYYWGALFPDIVSMLSPSEVLGLLAYNWPGNVREMERICIAVKWMRHSRDSRPEIHDLEPTEHRPLFLIKQGYTSLRPYAPFTIGFELRKAQIDPDLLNSLLNRYGVGVGITDVMFSFPNYDRSKDMNVKRLDDLEVGLIDGVKAFDKAYEGLEIYCELFRQRYWDDKDLLNIWDGELESSPPCINEVFVQPSKKYAKLFSKINAFMNTLLTDKKTNEPPLFLMTERKVLKYYHEGLLKSVNGNQRKAAKIAGLAVSTYRDHCVKCGISLHNAEYRII